MPGHGRCDGCGSPVAPGDAFCTECGASVPKGSGDAAYVTCPHCHAATPGSLSFCTECGYRIDEPAPADTMPTEPVPVVTAPPPPPPTPPVQPDRPPARRRGLVAGIVAAVVVVALGVTGAVYLLRPKDEPTTTPTGASSTSADAAAPGADAVTEVRRARFRLVVVGCPKGVVADAVSVGDSHVLVPSSVVEGASKVLLTGTAKPEPGYVLGADTDTGVAVLKVPALADKGGGTVATTDPAVGTKVVVVGATGRDDVQATVAKGDKGTTLQADHPLPLGGVVADRDGHVAGQVGPDSALLPASALSGATAKHGGDAPVELATCDRPAGPPDPSVLVAERPQASGDAAAVVDRLVAYYQAVNQRQLRKAYAMRSTGDYASFAAGFRTTYNVGMVIGPPRVSGDRATVRVSFTSTQNAEQAPEGTGQTCTRWKVTHGMDRTGGDWKVGKAMGSSYTACE